MLNNNCDYGTTGPVEPGKSIKCEKAVVTGHKALQRHVKESKRQSK